jgi:hypothetical protein
MITLEKLRLYEKYGGDMDHLSLSERESIIDHDWSLIDEILQGLLIVQAGLANSEFEAKVRARTIDAAQDEQVYVRLLQLSKTKA